MTPTICSDKKQLRGSNMKDASTRRRLGMASTSSSTSSTSTEASLGLRYVGKGSMNGTVRQRRRMTRLHRRLPALTTQADGREKMTRPTQTTGKVIKVEQDLAMQRMEVEEDDAEAAEVEKTQVAAQAEQLMDGNGVKSSSQARIHSSSDSRLPIKTVLQPIKANTNNNQLTDSKHCDARASEDSGDSGDSGYELVTVKSSDHQHHYHHNNTNGLVAIAIKTIKLVQRNKLLQKRLAQLQLETSEFIASVLANPENRHFREIKAKTDAANKVSSMLLQHRQQQQHH